MAMLYQASHLTTPNVNARAKAVPRKKQGSESANNSGGGTFSIGKFEEYLETRSTLDVNLPSSYDHDTSFQSELIGESISETFQLNRKWLVRTARFLLYFIIGCVYYNKVEGWNFITTMYFIAQTVSTVGYGNIAPKTYNGRTFTIFFMFTGILLVFSVIGDITSYLVRYVRKGYQKPRKQSRVSIIVRNAINALMWMCILLFVLCFGSTVFALNEGWSFHDAFYFSCVTATSIGYGDLALKKDSSIWFNIFFILVSVATTALALDKIGNVKRHIVQAEHDQQMNAIELTPDLLTAINKDSDKITKAEFILHMLQLDGKLEKARDIDVWDERFKEFDLDHDGYLTMNDCNSFKKIVEKIDLGKMSRKRPNKKKSIFLKAAEETRDVFLETFKLKTISEDKEEEDGASFETESPMARAESGEINFKPGSPKRGLQPHDSVSSVQSLNDWSRRIEAENAERRASSISSVNSAALQEPFGGRESGSHRSSSITAAPNPARPISPMRASSNNDIMKKASHRSLHMSSNSVGSSKHSGARSSTKGAGEEEEEGASSPGALPAANGKPLPQASTFVPFNVGSDDDVLDKEP